MSPVMTELIRAGALSSLLSIAGLLLAPPYQEMNAQRANCAAIVEAGSYSLALVANPDRVLLNATQAENDKALWKLVDEQTHIINKKAGEMGATQEPPTSRGPGVKAVREFLNFAKQSTNSFTPGRGVHSQEHWNKINAVQAGCKEQYSSLYSLPMNILGVW